MSDTHSKQHDIAGPADEFSKLFAAGDESGAVDVAMAALSSVPTSRHYRAMLGIIILILLLMPFGLMVAGHWLVDPSLPQARLGIGAAYWTVLFVLWLCLVELRLRLGLSRWWPTLLLAGVGIAWWGCAALWPASGRVCP